MEHIMVTVIKWIAAAVAAGFLWLLASYTDEYFRPYKKIRIPRKKDD